MADEVDDLETRMQTLMEQHITRTHDIIQSGYEKSKALCDEALLGMKKRSGVRSAVLDKALETLGVVQP
jgi:hypothetical protein